MGIGTVIVGTVILLTGVRHKLLVEITGAGSVGHCTHRSACGESGIFHSLVFLRVTVDILHAVKHDVVVEARVATLERMVDIPFAGSVIKGITVGHTVVCHIIGSRLVDMVVLGAKRVGTECTAIVVTGVRPTV